VLVVETLEGINLSLRLSSETARAMGDALLALAENQPKKNAKAN
jgi:hypothetical protein